MLMGLSVFRARPLFVDWDPLVLVGVAGSVIASGIGVCIASRRRHMVPVALTVAAIVATLGAHYVVLSSAGPSPVERMASLIESARQGNEPYARHAVFNRNLIFYTKDAFVELPVLRAAEELLREPARALVVLKVEDVETLEARGVPLARLGEVTYLNTGSLTLRTLLDPTPNRLERVVLVANR